MSGGHNKPLTLRSNRVWILKQALNIAELLVRTRRCKNRSPLGTTRTHAGSGQLSFYSFTHPSSPWEMSHESLSSRHRGLFDAALQDYEKTTNITLIKHPFAEQLQNCHSVESITTFLQDQVRESGHFQRGDEIMKSIKNIVSSICIVSATPALDDVVQLVCSSKGADGIV